jgi:hypothetical protein
MATKKLQNLRICELDEIMVTLFFTKVRKRPIFLQKNTFLSFSPIMTFPFCEMLTPV